MAHYRAHGRHHLPWRTNQSPYRVLVSEVMLQQTQTARVVPYFTSFLDLLPTVRALAAAPLQRVLGLWQGLGYNRRAKMLHDCAKTLLDVHRGTFPTDRAALEALPGVGPYTAGAIMAFSFDKPVPIIETNIRCVYLHHFFKGHTNVPDRAIMPFIARMLPARGVRLWYAALMDYGAHLKAVHGNHGVRSAHYKKQSPFAGSDRQIRGAIVRALTTRPRTYRGLCRAHTFDRARIRRQLAALEKEGLVVRARGMWTLPAA